ncbi:SA1362 family protein [Bacillus massilinigeriensis]|uniref:SA1362 family protein n=1 Tax=Bacillus mediterraneensis TaxID=1805474 RepID=UPI0008F87145
MYNRTSFYVVFGLIILAVIGVAQSLFENPFALLQTVGGVMLVAAIVFLIINRFSKANPMKQEQRSFHKAAKQSKKRFQAKNHSPSPKRTSVGSLSAARKKKDSPHLTVIEGKKGKKKNRASF